VATIIQGDVIKSIEAGGWLSCVDPARGMQVAPLPYLR